MPEYLGVLGWKNINYVFFSWNIFFNEKYLVSITRTVIAVSKILLQPLFVHFLLWSFNNGFLMGILYLCLISNNDFFVVEDCETKSLKQKVWKKSAKRKVWSKKCEIKNVKQ